MLIQDRFDYFFCGVLIVVVGGGGGDKWDCILLVRDGRRSEGGGAFEAGERDVKR